MTIKEQLDKALSPNYVLDNSIKDCEAIVEDIAIMFNLWVNFESSAYIENNNTAWILGNRYTMKELFKIFKQENNL